MVVISLLYTALHEDWGISKLEEGMLAAVIFLGFLIGNIVGACPGLPPRERLRSRGRSRVSERATLCVPWCVPMSCVGQSTSIEESGQHTASSVWAMKSRIWWHQQQ